MPTEPFQLSVSLTRSDVVEWLKTVPPDKLPQVVENTLAAGNLALSLLEASTGEQTMQRFFRPVLEPMGQLKETIDGILRATQKSQRLGELGEDIVAKQLTFAFPGDDFQTVSTQEHEADIHAQFATNDGQASKALIEVKFYSDDVPSAEIAKFRKDLKSTGFAFGLMISLSSRLAGITGQLHLEETADYVAVFVPNAGLDGHRLLCATAMLKALVLYQARNSLGRRFRTGGIEQAWERLNSELQELKEATGEVKALKESLQAAQQSLATVLGKITEKAISAELRLRYAVNRITNKIAEELMGLPHTSDPIALLPPAKPDEILAFIDGLRLDKDCRLQTFEALYDLAGRLGLQIRLDGSRWQLLRNGVIVTCTGGSRNRLDALVPINADDSTTLRPKLERIKNDYVVIDGTNAERMLARLEHRLGCDPFGD
jgi:hypothetical protein